MTVDLSITIVNYNTRDLLEQCLNSIITGTAGITYEIIVVDNASTDKSIEMMKTKYPQVKIITNNTNLFFTKAHNQALKISNGRYLMILNSDTFILDNAFQKLVDFMDKHSKAGACGPKIFNAGMTLQHSSDRMPTFLYGLFDVLFINTLFPNNPIRKHRIHADWDRNSLQQVDSVAGCCVLVRKEVTEKVGLLDEGFLIYWEEIDWCTRIVQSGWKIYYIPESQIVHYWQVAMDKHGRGKKERIFNNSFLYYYRKHYGLIAWIILAAILRLWKVPVLKVARLLKGNR